MNLASDTGEKLVYGVSCVKVRHFLQGFWFVSVCEVGVTTYHAGRHINHRQNNTMNRLTK